MGQVGKIVEGGKKVAELRNLLVEMRVVGGKTVGVLRGV